MTHYNRVLLKLSGESLGGRTGGIDPQLLQQFAEEISQVASTGLEVGIVIGGGNIFRGLSAQAAEMDRVVADQMGMLATVINSLALGEAIKKNGTDAVVLSAVPMEPFARGFSKQKALQYFSQKKVLIIAGGTGNPYFTTDTAAVLRAVEIEAQVILKGTRVDGVYSSDPEKDSDAVLFENLTYMEVISKNLRVMDLTAISLAQENRLPIVVFNASKAGNLSSVIKGEKIGTKVGD